MRIRVKSVGAVEKEKKYFFFPLTYDEDGKEKTRKILSFQEEPYKALKGAKEGDQYDVELKKEGEYWNWHKVTAVSGSSNTPVNAGNKWVPDAERQRSIVRQSSLAQSVASIGAGATVEDILDRAAQFEEWVNRKEEEAAE